MFKSIIFAFCLLLSHQAVAQDFLPAANIQFYFGGSTPNDLHLQLAATRFISVNDKLEPLPIVAANFNLRGPSYPSLLGLPLTASTFRANLDETQGESGYNWWWIGAGVAAAAVVAVAASSGGSGGDGGSGNSENNNDLGVNRCVVGGVEVLIPPPVCTPAN